jgi:DNA segregation ATPase FtsK/SpoIIIE, S-DNA-T family
LSPRLTTAEARDWSQRLRTLVRDRAAAERAAIEHRSDALRTERADYERAYAAVVAALEAERQELADRYRGAHEDAGQAWEDALRHQAEEAAAAITDCESRHDRELQAAQKRRDETVWLVGSLLDEQSADSPLQQLHRLESQVEAAQQELQQAVAEADALSRQALAYVESCRLSTEVGLTEPQMPPPDLVSLRELCLQSARDVEAPYHRLMGMWLPRLYVGLRPVGVFLLLTACLGGGLWWLIDPGLLGVRGDSRDTGWIAIVLVSAGGVSLATLSLLHLVAGQRVFPLLTAVFAKARAAQALLARWQNTAGDEIETAHRDCDQRHSRRLAQRDEALQKAALEFAERSRALAESRQSELEQLRSSADQHRRKLEADRDIELARLSRAEQGAWQEFETRCTSSVAELNALHQQRLTEIEQTAHAAWTELRSQWLDGLGALTAQVEQWQAATPTARDWSGMLRDAPAPDETTATDAIPIARLKSELAQLDDGQPEPADLLPPVTAWELPVSLDLRRQPGLLIRSSDAAGQQAAVRLLHVTILRLMDALPPGRVRLTILDPVSLGEQFAAFMHLADFDELLISSRIWTEPGQIEQRLADLTEHMETVLQMFLRNEYATLEEYNRQAGEVAEPYRVLVVSGLPVNFTDIALRRLWNIVTSGARCGVIPLIVVHEQTPLPRGFTLSDLEPHLTVLTAKNGALRHADPELSRWSLEVVEPPTAAELGELVKCFGRRAGDVRRVEVPFSRVAPAAEGVWSGSAARGIAVPIGRAGATKVQSVALGSGTSQHALIAGKTGSGKSTLLHALITNAALHYSPHELELYLVDFKKGVEFKVYARHNLPHARVVGIESDREFGVSVLERLDAVLEERSVLFREAGVPDLAGFREKRPTQPLPRILLIIDEFQEFFVEDDPLSQTAALLLDRLIRQGRAFGVHVVLGSQTLAGAYSLARSTLGQVAVRIALQCSETDAHLILSEDNAAARLLTRPGEAIYNDANGLAAGNHLFQVVWLDEAERDRYLAQIREQTDSGDWSLPKTIVFEGNVPADLSSLPVAATVNGHRPKSAVTAWLGEAVSLRGSLGLEFAASAGNHLLLAGQDETAAVGVLTGCVLSVTQPPATDHRVLVFNGSPQERTAAAWTDLQTAIPAVALHDISELEPQLDALLEEIRSREGGLGPRIWLCLFDLVRFRKLRKQDDDFGFGGFDKSKSQSLGDRFAEILRDGPLVGVHVWAWSDSLNTVNRWLTRDMQQQFEYRVAFAMNAADSSQFIDSPAASRLGVNRAWLFRGDRGTLDKFRPYHPAPIGRLRLPDQMASR